MSDHLPATTPSHRLSSRRQTITVALALTLACFGRVGHADLAATGFSEPGDVGRYQSEPAEQASAATRQQTNRLNLTIPQDRVLGIHRFHLDAHTEVLGWQVANRWYVGRQRGEDSGLTLVWQRDGRDQLSLSRDGLRVSRRF